jgi:uncharacterized protein YkwD
MMPSKFRVASAGAAGVVGLIVAGLIVFGTDPLGRATTDIAVPAAQGAAATRTPVEADSAPSDHSTLKPGQRHWPRPHATKRLRPTPHTTYRPRLTIPHRRTTYRPRPTYTSPTVHPTATTTTTARPTAGPAPSTTTASRPSTKPPTASATPTSASPTPTAASPTTTAASAEYAVRSDWAAAVLSSLNSQRADHGLPALSTNAKLVTSAHRHNLVMAEANQLSHQLSGEAGLGDRISAAGYSWSSVGENIAYNSNRSQAGVLALQQAMYNETAPNDGHRRNILSSSFTEVGIDVIDDSRHGKVWLVTDFGRP